MFEVLEHSLKSFSIQAINNEKCAWLVGIGTDGASTNIAGGDLKGLVEAKLLWIFWSWCLARRLELAIKDALTGTSFDSIDEILLNLYPKITKRVSAAEGSDIWPKGNLSLVDGESKPIRASGSRWIGYKWNAMKRVLARYGAYTNHLCAMSKDHSFKPADRSKMLGYYKQWTNAKYILGYAVFTNLLTPLTPCAILSKTMQSDQLDMPSLLYWSRLKR